MASRQAITIGFPAPNFVNESGTRDAILPGDYLSETIDTGVPFVQADWPNPRGPQQDAITRRTWTNSFKLELLGQDKVYGDPGEIPSYDWPNPRGYARSIDLRTHLSSRAVAYSDTPLQQPLSQHDWPSPPLGKQPPSIDLRTHICSLVTSTLGLQVFAPFSQRDWPNPPLGKERAIDLRTHLSTSVLGTLGLALGAPFSLTDWPNPRGPLQGSITQRTWTDQYKLTLIGQDEVYGAPGEVPAYDWPNPRGYARAIGLRTNISTQKTLGLQVFNPFSQHSWPNPRGAVPAITLRTWTEYRNLALAFGPVSFRLDQTIQPITMSAQLGVIVQFRLDQ